MPFVVTETSLVTCTHGGVATPTIPSTAVFVQGVPVILLPPPWTIKGCSIGDVAGVWEVGSLAVSSFGMPLLLQNSVGESIMPMLPIPVATGPLVVEMTQTVVSAL